MTLAEQRERVRRFIAAIEGGLSDNAAAHLVGISMDTLHRWKTGKRRDGAETPYSRLIRDRVARAKALRQQRWLDSIQAAASTPLNNGAPGDWRAAAWLAERVHPDEYGQRTTTALTGPGGGAIAVEGSVERTLVIEASEERLAKVMNLLVQAGKVPALSTGETNGSNGSNGHQADD